MGVQSKRLPKRRGESMPRPLPFWGNDALRIRDAGPRSRNDKERILFVLALRHTSKREKGCDYICKRKRFKPPMIMIMRQDTEGPYSSVFSSTALLTRPRSPALVHVGCVKVIVGSLGDGSLIERQASKSDVVFACARFFSIGWLGVVVDDDHLCRRGPCWRM